MARLLNGLNGGVVGRLGDQVYYQRRGKTYVRQYNDSPADPKTPAQVQQRGRFSAGSRVWRTLADAGLVGLWNLDADLKAAQEAWYSANLQNLLLVPDAQQPDNRDLAKVQVQDREQFILSRGNAPDTGPLTAVADAASGILVEWTPQPYVGWATDQVWVVAYNATRMSWITYPFPTPRVRAMLQIDVPAGELSQGDELWIWASVLRPATGSPFRKAEASATVGVSVVVG